MHVNVEEDAGIEEEDIDQGKNIFVQKKVGGVVNKSWVLLDSQNTVNQVTNPGLLVNIRKAKNPGTIHCNAKFYLQRIQGRVRKCDSKAQPLQHCECAHAKQSKLAPPSDV